MANSAMLVGGRIFVHCDACGSEGHSPATRATRVPGASGAAPRFRIEECPWCGKPLGAEFERVDPAPTRSSRPAASPPARPGSPR